MADTTQHYDKQGRWRGWSQLGAFRDVINHYDRDGKWRGYSRIPWRTKETDHAKESSPGGGGGDLGGGAALLLLPFILAIAIPVLPIVLIVLFFSKPLPILTTGRWIATKIFGAFLLWLAIAISIGSFQELQGDLSTSQIEGHDWLGFGILVFIVGAWCMAALCLSIRVMLRGGLFPFVEYDPSIAKWIGRKLVAIGMLFVSGGFLYGFCQIVANPPPSAQWMTFNGVAVPPTVLWSLFGFFGGARLLLWSYRPA